MDQKDFLTRRTNALAREMGSMSLLRAAADVHDHQAVPDALRLLSAWLTRDLTDKECWQLRSVAYRMGVDVIDFDQQQVAKEKHHG